MEQNTLDQTNEAADIVSCEIAEGVRVVKSAQPMAHKVLSVGIPCYNSAEYMDHAIESILAGSDYADDIEVIVVDDGSVRDNTAEKADEWVRRYPAHVKAVHQVNGGHGIAVLAGLTNAEGTYYKVCDSDDWYDGDALKELLALLRDFEARSMRVDLVVTNYVYEHTFEGKSNTIDYRFALKRDQVLTWDEIGNFGVDQYLLMHALCYRRDVLVEGGIPMPAHTFYVDNIYAYVPLPRCKTLYYLDVDLYRYFIGRDDQSVNESVMVGRIDQQLRVTRIMMEAYHLYDDVPEKKLRKYMQSYFNIMMSVCSIFSKKSDAPDALDNLEKLWDDLKAYDEKMYKKARYGFIGIGSNLPGETGTKATMVLYKAAQKLVKFN